jgi:carboxyl-terminal processing protease
MNRKIKHTRAKKRIILVLLGVFIFSLGYLLGHGNLQFEKNRLPRLVKQNLGQPKDIDFSLFWDVYNKINKEGLHKLDAQKSLYGAISGAVASADDPYSTFLTPEETKLFMDDLSGKVEGIGAEIGRRNGIPMVITPIEGAPAAKAGLKKGDKIMAIDEQSTDKMSLDIAVLKIRGKKGTQVKLTILRENEDKTQDITITRDEIVVEDVDWRVERNVAVIRIRQFGDSVDSDMAKISSEIKAKKIDRAIIDLRDNPGGLLDKVVTILGDFLPNDTVAVKQVSRDGQTEELKTDHTPSLQDVKIIVLVNDGSASASEIFAGAVQDQKRGLILGVKSFGKGTVQLLENLKGGSSLKLTVAKWLTPAGREIDKNGISPDITVEMTDKDYDAGRDPQLDQAFIEIMK